MKNLHLTYDTQKIASPLNINEGNPFFQSKSPFNDACCRFEKEADGVADTMRQMGNSTIQTKAGSDSFFNPAPSSINTVQRKCAGCEDEEKQLQRKEMNDEEATADNNLESYVDNLSNRGQPLPDEVRNFYEPRFGYNFSNVKVHTDSVAGKSAQSINALAYTSGNNIVFNDGQYSPQNDSGKRLLGHELTHVVQQTGKRNQVENRLVQRDASGSAVPSPATTAGNTPPAPAPVPASTTVSIASNCNQADITDIVTEALTWLDDIYQQLIEYDADYAFKDDVTPSGSYSRVAGALQQAFNTNDITYAEVIRRRFLNVAKLLRAQGSISINCDRQHCGGGSSSIIVAYVVGPYTLTICSTGVPGARPISTFIHELMHAAVPRVGITNTVTTNGGVSDRAYRTDRVFTHLSPEETLDNAESYGILAELLHARVNTQIITPQSDTTTGCRNPAIILEAFARASQWNDFAWNGLNTDVSLLQGAPLSTLNPANLELLNRAFPNITTTAQLVDLANAFDLLHRSGFANNWDFACSTAKNHKCSSCVVYTTGGKISSSAVMLSHITAPHALVACPGWFTLSADDRIKTIFAAFIIGRPSWIVRGFNLHDALQYAEGARVFVNETIPPPVTTSARQHIESDFQFRPPSRRVP